MIHLDVMLASLSIARKNLIEGRTASDYRFGQGKFNDCLFLLDGCICNLEKEIAKGASVAGSKIAHCRQQGKGKKNKEDGDRGRG